jgi:hypothetical protein
LIASSTGPGVWYRNASEKSSDDVVCPPMSSAIEASSAFDAECGEKATRASMPGRPRSAHFAESVSRKC